MPGSTIDEILNRLHTLQAELEREIDELLNEKSQQFQYTLERGRVRFTQGMLALQRHRKTGLWSYLRQAPIGHLLSAPVIYSLIVPFAMLDLMVTFYQQICFRIYRIPRVTRGDYIAIDRQQLAYLNIIEKLNCTYCAYANGLIEYIREIAARTEKYWCPIKHARRTRDPHRLVNGFIDYGDADNYHERFRELRVEIARLKKRAGNSKD
jgi:hypothetical protein